MRKISATIPQLPINTADHPPDDCPLFPAVDVARVKPLEWSAKSDYVEQDLQCRDCGEIGIMHRDDSAFWVSCERDGEECCSTMQVASEALALALWDRLTSEPEDEWLSDFEEQQ